METEYQLLDTGNEQRLELFGDKRVIRPAKQARWRPSLPKSEWHADLTYTDDGWMGDLSNFQVNFNDVCFSLSPMDNGQVGVFPEQMENWAWLSKINTGEKFKILNGFAYTGGSTLFASNGINSVTHLDASKPAIKRAKENTALSFKSENDIRFIQDDVITFMEKEIKRGNKYNGFIFDPPAFGTGGKGKKWKLKKDLPSLMELVYQLSDGAPSFILLTAHDPSLNHETLLQTIKKLFQVNAKMESGDLIMSSKSGNNMKNGYFARCITE